MQILTLNIIAYNYAWLNLTMSFTLAASWVWFYILVSSTPRVFSLQLSVTVRISPCHNISLIAISLITNYILVLGKTNNKFC